SHTSDALHKLDTHLKEIMSMLRKKPSVLGIGGVLAAGLFGASPLSLARPAAAAPSAPVTSSLPPVHPGGGRRRPGCDEALAEALGIELADLEAAEEEARIAMIDQAVADGLLTEAQAEQLKASSMGFGRGFSGYDKDEYLAAALGITVEELEAAELTALQTEV